MIFGVRITVGQEDLVAEIMEHKAKNEERVYSILVMPNVKGYIILETEDELSARRFIAGIPHVKGLMGGPIDPEELKGVFAFKPLLSEIKVGSIVKLVAGPYRGEKAKVVRVDEKREEVTVELLEAAVKIPVTVPAENVRIVEGEEHG